MTEQPATAQRSEGQPQPPKLTASLAAPFLAGMVLLCSTAVVALHREAVSLRPWKSHQREYVRQRASWLERELAAARAEMDAEPLRARREALLATLAAEEAKLRSPSLQPQLQQLDSRIAVEEEALARGEKELRVLRGRQQELEYRLGGVAEPEARAPYEALRVRSAEMERLVQACAGRKQRLVQQREALVQPRNDARAALEATTDRVRGLEVGRRALREEGIEVRQVLVEDADRVDRCVSCHVTADGSRPPGEDPPFTTHPGAHVYLRHHAPERFGCTLCHQGQGRALSSVTKAHGEVPFWSEPLLRGEWAQASCQRCHEDVRGLRGAERLARGVELLEKSGCFGCHKIAGYEQRPRIGPPLSRVAEKVSHAWLLRWLRDPRATQPRSRMPNFGFGARDAAAIADFLFSLSGTTRSDEKVPEASFDLIEQGRAFYGRARCGLCHSAGERGGAFAKAYAPDLSRAGSKLRRAWLIAWLEDPRAYHALSRMPRFRFTPAQRGALAEFVRAEGTDPDIEMEKRPAPEPLDAESVARGRRLVEEFGCGGCHEVQGLERVERIGPELKRAAASDKVGAELSTIGSKPLELLDFGRATIPRTRKDYLLTKLETPRAFREGLRMPDFQFSHEEREALATLLLGFSSKEMPRRLVVAKPAASFDPGGAGGRLVRDLQCLTCHRIRGVGGDYAPDLSLEGSRAQREWIEGFLLAPSPVRPLLEQMPRFNLTAEEARTLADFIAVSLRDPRVEAVPEGLQGTPERGGRLYRERGCALCHQIGNAGGAVGPDLTAVRRRLQPAYLRHHFLDPRLSRAEGPEPRYDWTEEQMADVSAYLGTVAGREEK